MLKALFSALAIAEIKARIDTAIHNGALTIAAALMALIAAGFLVAALFLALTVFMPALFACLIMSVLFVLVAGLLLANRRKPTPSARPGGAAMMGALGGSVATIADAPDPSRPAPPKGARKGGGPGGILDKIPGGAMTLLPIAAFLAALLAGRRRP